MAAREHLAMILVSLVKGLHFAVVWISKMCIDDKSYVEPSYATSIVDLP